jgi:hypothetical protein
MALSPNRQLALYMLLSHPISIVRIQLDFLAPANSLNQAALDVANLINGTLALGLGQGDINDIQTFLAGSGAIKTSGGVFKISGNPTVLAKAFDNNYDPGTGCPDSNMSATIFTTLA